jgi:carbohydrate-selective porin OprB
LGVGIFGRIGFADNKTSPIERFYSLGVGGKGLIPGRERDTFGVGYYDIRIRMSCRVFSGAFTSRASSSFATSPHPIGLL